MPNGWNVFGTDSTPFFRFDDPQAYLQILMKMLLRIIIIIFFLLTRCRIFFSSVILRDFLANRSSCEYCRRALCLSSTCRNTNFSKICNWRWVWLSSWNVVRIKSTADSEQYRNKQGRKLGLMKLKPYGRQNNKSLITRSILHIFSVNVRRMELSRVMRQSIKFKNSL